MNKSSVSVVFKVMNIIRGTTVDGPGFRTAIYLSGCSHQCLGCHNPQSWNPEAGTSMSLEEIMEIVNEEDFDVTISGGDPLYHPESLEVLVKALKNNRRNIWIYTGYTWEQILISKQLLDAIKLCDVLVDDVFRQELRDPDLPFRGSSNQRIIKIPDSLKEGKIILWSLP